jgi:endo-1,4-beta-xylanase
MIMKINLNICLLAFIIVSCSQSKNLTAGGSSKGLKDYYRKYFDVGVAANMNSLRGDDSALLMKEFNSITPENDLKIGPVHPAENQYNWRNADAIVAFAQRNKVKVRGHNLVWHYASQTPRWIFIDKDGKEASKELVLQRLKDHITTVVSRYKGKIFAWDVANEVISDAPNEYLRPSDWYRICGEDYIIKAFQWAHEADPEALLFYNDYNEIDPVKREKIYRLVKSLKDAGVPIHGIGLQAHWGIYEPTRGQLDSTLSRFASLGLDIHITELDITVYTKEHNARERRPEDANTAFTADRENAQIEKYKMCFELFKKYNKAISSVTFWNLSDKYSWLDNFPVRNRKDYPLLFDQHLKPKKAYWEVVKLAK